MDRLRRIELFVRAAEAGSFARAARSLALTPSAVSHAVAALERQLGMSLFHRTTRQLRLTEEGEAVYGKGCSLLREIAELEGGSHGVRQPLSGTLRVGLSVALSRNIVMPMLPVFLRRYPSLQLEFHLQSQPKEMHAEGVDVLLRVTEPPESSLVARKIAQIRHAVYGAPQYLKAHGTPAHPEDLLKHCCLAMKVLGMSRPLDEWIFERGTERKVVRVLARVVTYEREGLIAAVLSGAGLMRLGCFDPELIASDRLRRVLPEWSCPTGYPIYALYRRSARMPAKVGAFLRFVEESFQTFDPGEITLLHARRHRTPEAAANRTGAGL